MRYQNEMGSMQILEHGYHFFEDRGEFHIKVPIHGGSTTRKVIFDLEDKEVVMAQKWGLLGWRRGHVVTAINGWVFRMSHVVLGLDHPDIEVTHINGNVLDNRKQNLDQRRTE
jgi:hypothetical protein